MLDGPTPERRKLVKKPHTILGGVTSHHAMLDGATPELRKLVKKPHANLSDVTLNCAAQAAAIPYRGTLGLGTLAPLNRLVATISIRRICDNWEPFREVPIESGASESLVAKRN